MSLKRLRNQATTILFPLIDYVTGEYYSGVWGELTSATIVAYHWSDGTAPQQLLIAGTPSQVASSGIWQLPLTADELNTVSQYIFIKIDADEISSQGITIDLVDALSETYLSQVKEKTDLIPASPATQAQVELCLQAANYTAPDNSGIADILTAIAALNNISVADILANQSMSDALTVLIGNHAISGSNLTHSREGAESITFELTDTTKVRSV